jgi:hypothetical protein
MKLVPENVELSRPIWEYERMLELAPHQGLAAEKPVRDIILISHE